MSMAKVVLSQLLESLLFTGDFPRTGDRRYFSAGGFSAGSCESLLTMFLLL